MSDADFLWKLVSVGSMIAALIACLASFRRKPPLESELYKDFVSKDEIDKCAARCAFALATRIKASDDIHQKIFDQIAATNKIVSEDFQNLERGLGRAEGKLDVLIKQKNG